MAVYGLTETQLHPFVSLSCLAVNQLLSKENHSHGGYLTVIPRDDPDYQHTLLAVPSKVSAKVGERAVLECISDDEHPIFQWSRIGGLTYYIT